MSGFQIRSMGQLSHFRAFRTIRLKDDRDGEIIKTEFSLSGINWAKPYRRFALHDVISFAKRLLREKYGIDTAKYDAKIGDMAEYVFLDMTRSIFDHERIERNIRAAYAELPPEKRELYGSVEDQLQYFGLGPTSTTVNPEAHE